MESYLIYIGKSALAAGAFYIAFLLLFQNQKHFAFNRFYLPVSLALSFLIPLITFTTVKYIEPVLSENTNSFAYLATASESVVLPEFVFQWYHYLFGLYILGVAGFLFHLLLGHVKAVNIIRFSRLKTLFGTEVNITPKDIYPFSFFNKIVVSENTLDSVNLQMIVNHENIHVKERHTLDILFVELLFLTQWFNPFAWLLKDAVKNNLEYKTDHQITKTNNPKDYQLAMVALADKQGVAPFLTALNGSQLKSRIIMMKKKAENKYALLKQLIVLPLLAILVMGLANREIRTEIIETEKKVEISQPDNEFRNFNEKDFLSIIIIVDGKVIPFDNPGLKSLDFSKGFDSNKIIKALKLNQSEVKSTVFSLDDEKHTLYIRTSNYFNGTDSNFEKITASPKSVKKEKKLVETFYAIDNNIVSKKQFKIQSEKGFDKLVILSDEHSTDKYGEKYTGTIVDATTNKQKVKGKVIDENGSPISNVEIFNRWGNLLGSSNRDGDFSIEAEHNKETFFIVKKGFNPISYELNPDKYGSEITINLEKTITENTNQDAVPKEYKIEYTPKTASHKITGKITDQNNNPIQGASIIIKGKPIGTITNSQGNYEIKLDEENETLIFRMAGFEKQEVKVENKTEINIKLKADKNAKTYKTYTTNEGRVYRNLIRSTVVDSHVKASKTQFLDSIKNQNSPIYIVEGKEIENLDSISPGDIINIDVLKNKLSTSIYGERGKNGAILITTKASVNKSKLVEGKIYDGKFGEMAAVNISDTVGNTVKEKPLIVIDGIISGYKSLDDIDPENIKNIYVLKDKAATEKYGDKGKNGVIEIALKAVDITSELQLRKFIAKEIKYPVLAQKANREKVVRLSVQIDKEGNIILISETEGYIKIRVDEVVIAAYKTKGDTGYGTKVEAENARKIEEQLLVDETKRVIKKIPGIDISEFKGKTVGITVRFILQD